MGCSESKNIVEPDSKKPEEKPEEKTAIVPVTSKNAKIQTDEIPEASKMSETEAHMPIEVKAKIVAAKNIQTEKNLNVEFPEINLTAADFAPENNVADLSPVFSQKEENKEKIFVPEKYEGTLETPRSSKIDPKNRIEQNQHSQKKDDENDYQLALKIEQEQLVQFQRMSTQDLLHIQNESASRGKTPELENEPVDGAVAVLSFGEKPGERKMYLSQGFEEHQIDALFRHNYYRSFHPGTQPLKLSMELCQQAKAGADELAYLNVFAHVTKTHGAGENLAGASPGYYGPTATDWTVGGTNAFYEEVNDYLAGLNRQTNMSDQETFLKWGHYSQLIWKDTFEMGVDFAWYTDPKKLGFPLVVTYRYRKHGNFNDQYASKCSLPEKTLAEIQRPIKDRLAELKRIEDVERARLQKIENERRAEINRIKAEEQARLQKLEQERNDKDQMERYKSIIDNDKRLMSEFSAFGIENWQIEAWKHFNSLRIQNNLLPVMLDLDLCSQCAKNDRKGYWAIATTEIMEENRLKEFVLDYITETSSQIFARENSYTKFTVFGIAVEISSKTELRLRIK